ncbi:LPS O-antigen length regulator [Providencia rettgeri]|uniref:LPS O-antigen length regulator n=4 Tax=Gammaproteobacteria TaxID=1236 RepID=A0A2R3LVD8_PRORE|nr:LPS O-antigen length regulator [Providencia rettgeri]NIL72850.1 LPS O-antigen length regulator [Providencia sp. 504mA]HCI97668.1 LPS O-antigen length regulator [Providencia sp.]EIL1984660.1 LPS O-antigen length regulator [Providencia rettgeri]EIU7557690.1 LPS O-antigen length regulator [Providencia rettgeri]
MSFGINMSNEQPPRGNNIEQKSNTAPQFHLQQNDEIDLMALFSILLKHKLLIIIFTAFCIVLSAGIVSFLPQKWSSTAIVIPPTSENIQEVNKLKAQLDALEIPIDLSAQRIFSVFVDQFRSKVNQSEYVKSTRYFQQLAQNIEPKDDVASQQRLVNQIITNDIQIQDQSKEKNSTSNDIVLKFTASLPIEAQDLLEGYIRYSASKVRQQIKVEIDNTVSQRLIFASESLKREVSKIQTEYDVKVERLKRAVDIAKAAGIEKPIASDSVTINDDPDYPIALGTEALEKKLLIETQNRDLALMSETLQNRQIYIDELNALTSKELDFAPVMFILTPDFPLQKDSPKSSLIVALSAVLGFILSCSFVLSRQLYRDYKQQNV